MSDLTKETWKYTWDYKKDGAFYHPMLSVSLIPNVLDGVTISCDALVDTGADWCIFPESFSRTTRH